MISINVNEIKNETLKKLTRNEIAAFGLYNAGIFTYKGILKARTAGCKTTLKTDTERHYENDEYRWEMIKIISTDEEEEFSLRLFNKTSEKYEEFYPVLEGLNFIK